MRSRSATLRDKRGNPVGTVRAFGKTVKKATANLSRLLRTHVRNVKMSLRNPKVHVSVRYPRVKGFLGIGRKPAKTVRASGQLSDGEADRILRSLGRQ